MNFLMRGFLCLTLTLTGTFASARWSRAKPPPPVSSNQTSVTGSGNADEDFCASAPCQNGAACAMLSTSYECTCDESFTGGNCELSVMPVTAPSFAPLSGSTRTHLQLDLDNLFATGNTSWVRVADSQLPPASRCALHGSKANFSNRQQGALNLACASKHKTSKYCVAGIKGFKGVNKPGFKSTIPSDPCGDSASHSPLHRPGIYKRLGVFSEEGVPWGLRMQQTLRLLKEHGMRLSFWGDSLTRQSIVALGCMADERAKRASNGEVPHETFDSLPEDTTAKYHNMSWSGGVGVSSTTQLVNICDGKLAKALERKARTPENEFLVIQIASAHQNLKNELTECVDSLLSKLDEVCGAPGRLCLLRGVPTQHHDTPTGAFASSNVSSKSSSKASAPNCAAQGGGSRTGANFWREDVLRERLSLRGPSTSILFFPMADLTAPLWDAHVATDKGSRRDCTHYCLGPFIWEPLEWAMHHVLSAYLKDSRRAADSALRSNAGPVSGN